MRLLNVHTLELRDFFDCNVPKYAILSHRWGKHEPSSEEFRTGRAIKGPGYKKVVNLCLLLRARSELKWSNQFKHDEWSRQKLDWCWVDTCCVDKHSSAELSESVNSAWKWYSRAAICVVYLADVKTEGKTSKQVLEAFCSSSWWTRGWTLPELLAPQRLLLVDADWRVLGHKCNRTCLCRYDASWARNYGPRLNEVVSNVTSIPNIYLEHTETISSASIARRMSWAAHRVTSREEDAAYCLLGLFDVHMPIVYGEGDQAFLRLQEEIVKRTNDQSIFAWQARWSRAHWAGLFARRPAHFKGLGDVECTGVMPIAPYTMTHNGVELRANVQRVHDATLKRDVYIVKLNCTHWDRTSGRQVPVELAVVPAEARYGPQSCGRVDFGTKQRPDCRTIYPDHMREDIGERLLYVEAWGYRTPM